MSIIKYILIIFFISAVESKIVGEIFGVHIVDICGTSFPIRISEIQKLYFVSNVTGCDGDPFFEVNDVGKTYRVECENSSGQWKCSGYGVEIWNVMMTCFDPSIQSCYITANVVESSDNIIAMLIIFLSCGLIVFILSKIT